MYLLIPDLIEGKAITLKKPGMVNLISDGKEVREAPMGSCVLNSANLFYICFGVDETQDKTRRDSGINMDSSTNTSHASSQGNFHM